MIRPVVGAERPGHPPSAGGVVVRFRAVLHRPAPGADGRHCSRPACADAAAVTLTYQYRRSQVWLDELSDERDPHAYDLCAVHAARLSVPLGWHLLDRRHPAAVALLAG